MQLKSIEEKIIWYYLICIYIWYLTGSLYLLSCLLGWTLAIRSLIGWYQGKVQIGKGVWMWLLFIGLFVIGSLIGNVEMGNKGVTLVRNVVSEILSVGLLAAFPLVGCLPIRPKVIYRAICIVVLQSVLLMPLFILARELRIPAYTSPLIKLDTIAKTGALNYRISFYSVEEPSRLSMFCPWAPALGFIASQFFFICKEESNRVMRWIGMIGSTLLVIVSYSRLGILVLPGALLITYMGTYIRNLYRFLMTSSIVSILVIFLSDIKEEIVIVKDSLNSARASSSIIRERLQEVARRRMWENPIFGHGSTEPGGEELARMPIGTHHTWNGFLFVNGLFGAACIFIPYSISLIYFVLRMDRSRLSRVAFSVLLVMGLYSVGETWKSLAYLLMPGLILVGIGFNEQSSSNSKEEILL